VDVVGRFVLAGTFKLFSLLTNSSSEVLNLLVFILDCFLKLFTAMIVIIFTQIAELFFQKGNLLLLTREELLTKFFILNTEFSLV
jgi:hypothetical protein